MKTYLYVELNNSESGLEFAAEAALTAETATPGAALAAKATTRSALPTLACHTVRLRCLEDTQELLGSEDGGEFGTVLALDVKALLLLLDLLSLSGEEVFQLCRGFFLGEFLVTVGTFILAIGASASGGHLLKVLLVGGLEGGFLLISEFQVLHEALGLPGLHLCTTALTVVGILCVCVADGAKGHGYHCEEKQSLFHCGCLCVK